MVLLEKRCFLGSPSTGRTEQVPGSPVLCRIIIHMDPNLFVTRHPMSRDDCRSFQMMINFSSFTHYQGDMPTRISLKAPLVGFGQLWSQCGCTEVVTIKNEFHDLSLLIEYGSRIRNCSGGASLRKIILSQAMCWFHRIHLFFCWDPRVGCGMRLHVFIHLQENNSE